MQGGAETCNLRIKKYKKKYLSKTLTRGKGYGVNQEKHASNLFFSNLIISFLSQYEYLAYLNLLRTLFSPCQMVYLSIKSA